MVPSLLFVLGIDFFSGKGLSCLIGSLCVIVFDSTAERDVEFVIDVDSNVVFDIDSNVVDIDDDVIVDVETEATSVVTFSIIFFLNRFLSFIFKFPLLHKF